MSLPDPYYQDEYCTIYHGDCRDVLPYLDPVDMILTDPPYGHRNNDDDLIARWEAALGLKEKAKTARPRPIQNDDSETANELIRWLFGESAKLLRTGGCCCCCCCCGGGGPDPQFARWAMWMDEPLDFKQMVVWDKGPMGMGWHYRRSYEVVLVAQKRGGACKWYDTTNRVENIIRHIPKIIPQKNDHPTPKPVELMGHFIRLHTATGDTVLDPFMGCGPTLVAAQQLGRKSIGIEIERKYCDVAVSRLRQEGLPFAKKLKTEQMEKQIT